MTDWQPIETAPTNETVLISFQDERGKWRWTKAMLVTEKTLEADSDYADADDYDEDAGVYFARPGWYEDVEAETGLNYSYHSLGYIKPTHWARVTMPVDAGFQNAEGSH